MIKGLMIKNAKTQRLRWNFAVLRKITLFCMWFGFHWVRDMMKAFIIFSWLVKSDFVRDWLIIVHKKKDLKPSPSATDKPELLNVLVQGVLKLRALLMSIADHVVRDEEKILIFCSYSATMLLIYEALRLLEIDVIIYTAELSAEDQEKAVNRFNDYLKIDKMFLTTYATDEYDMNL